MHTGQFYKRAKKTSPSNRIIIPSKESDEDMVGSSNSEMDISLVHVLEVLKNHL